MPQRAQAMSDAPRRGRWCGGAAGCLIACARGRCSVPPARPGQEPPSKKTKVPTRRCHFASGALRALGTCKIASG
eukprot:15180570-Alexandrium_andersonii.AAC.1